MSRSPLADAFAHHVWATDVLLATCASLTPEQLASGVPGTYGSILDTMRHLVAADAGYLALLSGGAVPEVVDEAALDIAAMRAVMATDGPAWQALLADGTDPDETMVRHHEDGSQSAAPRGIRLAQAIHHGTDHRSQVCTALTALGIEPPEIDAWAYAWQVGTLTETPAPAA